MILIFDKEKIEELLLTRRGVLLLGEFKVFLSKWLSKFSSVPSPNLAQNLSISAPISTNHT